MWAPAGAKYLSENTIPLSASTAQTLTSKWLSTALLQPNILATSPWYDICASKPHPNVAYEIRFMGHTQSSNHISGTNENE